MKRELLVMKNIDKSFPGVHALDHVNFDLRSGEVHALLGENGAGKSTLMKILTGVYQMDGGEIEVAGEPVTITNAGDAQKLGISIIYQEFNLFPHLSVAENLFIKREPRKYGKWILDGKKLHEQSEELLQRIQLNLDPARPVSSLSVAQQQMVEIAKALSLNAKIMIMDEPTSALTDHEIENLFSLILQLKKQNVGIVYISHRLEELSHIADRVTVLRDGKYVGTVNYSDTTTRELVSMMVGRELSEYFPQREHAYGAPILEVEGLSRKGAVNDVSFTLHEGEILGVSGLMGAGRTEMARLLFGADRKDGGTVTFKGEQIEISSPGDAIKRGIGYLTEDRKRDGLTLGLNVKDNITMASIKEYASMLGVMNEGKIEKATSEYVDQLSIKTPSLEQLLRNLSGGNQQKVILARWLCKGSKILIFDEPTRGIDVGAKQEIYELMNSLVKEGHSIIMISSELPEILGMSDRILVMHEGRVAGILDGPSATEESIMYLATGGK